jgi:hypothetical protein
VLLQAQFALFTIPICLLYIILVPWQLQIMFYFEMLKSEKKKLKEKAFANENREFLGIFLKCSFQHEIFKTD